MPDKFFLETYPLYKKFITTLDTNLRLFQIPRPSIKMFCKDCKSEQTYNQEYDFFTFKCESNPIAYGNCCIIKYKCDGCKKLDRFFFVKFDKSEIANGQNEKEVKLTVTKIGQYPAWEIKSDIELSKLLGEFEDYFKRGLICESQSYGIGAYAYYRRVTEEIIEELLGYIEDLLGTDEKKKNYKQAFEKVKKEKRTTEKINLVKDLLPASLKAGELNPLQALHDALSVGLHGMSDEQCMENAEKIRVCLVFLVNQIIKSRNDKKEFSEGIRKILSPKN